MSGDVIHALAESAVFDRIRLHGIKGMEFRPVIDRLGSEEWTDVESVGQETRERAALRNFPMHDNFHTPGKVACLKAMFRHPAWIEVVGYTRQVRAVVIALFDDHDVLLVPELRTAVRGDELVRALRACPEWDPWWRLSEYWDGGDRCDRMTRDEMHEAEPLALEFAFAALPEDLRPHLIVLDFPPPSIDDP